MSRYRSAEFGYASRLHRPGDFRKFFSPDGVFRLKECVVFQVQNNVGHFRLGITIKSRGRSVDRNKVKRVVRELFRAHSDILGSNDYNVVIPGSKRISFPYPNRLDLSLRQEFFTVLAQRRGS